MPGIAQSSVSAVWSFVLFSWLLKTGHMAKWLFFMKWESMRMVVLCQSLSLEIWVVGCLEGGHCSLQNELNFFFFFFWHQLWVAREMNVEPGMGII